MGKQTNKKEALGLLAELDPFGADLDPMPVDDIDMSGLVPDIDLSELFPEEVRPNEPKRKSKDHT